jgi:hypothetical protein
MRASHARGRFTDRKPSVNEHASGAPFSWALILTPEERLEITNAFGPAKRNHQSSSIEKFIFQADRYVLFFRDVTREPPKAIKAQLMNAAHAASRFASALSDLNDEARQKIILAGTELKKHTALTGRQEKDPADKTRPRKQRAENVVDIVADRFDSSDATNYTETYLRLEQLEINLRLVERDITHATNAFKVTKGTRLHELIAADVASDLFLVWFSVFGKKGSLVAGLEFHRVAAVVANLLGFKIGSKTLVKADDGRVAQRLADGYYASES